MIVIRGQNCAAAAAAADDVCASKSTNLAAIWNQVFCEVPETKMRRGQKCRLLIDLKITSRVAQKSTVYINNKMANLSVLATSNAPFKKMSICDPILKRWQLTNVISTLILPRHLQFQCLDCKQWKIEKTLIIYSNAFTQVKNCKPYWVPKKVNGIQRDNRKTRLSCSNRSKKEDHWN